MGVGDCAANPIPTLPTPALPLQGEGGSRSAAELEGESGQQFKIGFALNLRKSA